MSFRVEMWSIGVKGRSGNFQEKQVSQGESQGCLKLEHTASNSMAITTPCGYHHYTWRASWSGLRQREKSPKILATVLTSIEGTTTRRALREDALGIEA